MVYDISGTLFLWSLATLVGIVVFWIVPMVMGARLARDRGRHLVLGLGAGGLLGWIGVVLLLVLLDQGPSRVEGRE